MDCLVSFAVVACVKLSEGLESKLDGLRSQARESYRHLHASRKRPKETSSLDVSPHTAHSRPPAKQFMSSRRLFDDQDSKCFDSNKYAITIPIYTARSAVVASPLSDLTNDLAIYSQTIGTLSPLDLIC